MDPNLPQNISEIKLPFPSHALGQKIIMFGLPTCPHCANVKKFFAQHQIDYEYHDLETDIPAREWVMSFVEFVPVLVLKDGSLVYGPNDQELTQRLGIN